MDPTMKALPFGAATVIAVRATDPVGTRPKYWLSCLIVALHQHTGLATATWQTTRNVPSPQPARLQPRSK